MKKGLQQRLLQETFVYMHVLHVMESFPANIANCGVQTCNISSVTVLCAISWEFLKFYDIHLYLKRHSGTVVFL